VVNVLVHFILIKGLDWKYCVNKKLYHYKDLTFAVNDFSVNIFL